MSDPDIRSIRVEGIGYEEYRRGSVGYYLLGLVEQSLKPTEPYPGYHQATWDGDKTTTCTCALTHDHPIEQTTIAHHSSEQESS